MDELLSAYGEERMQDSSLPPRKRVKINATPDVPDVLIVRGKPKELNLKKIDQTHLQLF